MSFVGLRGDPTRQVLSFYLMSEAMWPQGHAASGISPKGSGSCFDPRLCEPLLKGKERDDMAGPRLPAPLPQLQTLRTDCVLMDHVVRSFQRAAMAHIKPLGFGESIREPGLSSALCQFAQLSCNEYHRLGGLCHRNDRLAVLEVRAWDRGVVGWSPGGCEGGCGPGFPAWLVDGHFLPVSLFVVFPQGLSTSVFELPLFIGHQFMSVQGPL